MASYPTEVLRDQESAERGRAKFPIWGAFALAMLAIERVMSRPGPMARRRSRKQTTCSPSQLQGATPDDADWVAWAETLHPAEAALVHHSISYVREHGDDAPTPYV